MDVNKGVRAVESGVVPTNRIINTGFVWESQIKEEAAILANKEVLPQPPAP